MTVRPLSGASSLQALGRLGGWVAHVEPKGQRAHWSKVRTLRKQQAFLRVATPVKETPDLSIRVPSMNLGG